METPKFKGPADLFPFDVTVRGETHQIQARDERDAIVLVLNPLGLRWGEEKVTVVPTPKKSEKQPTNLRRVK